MTFKRWKLKFFDFQLNELKSVIMDAVPNAFFDFYPVVKATNDYFIIRMNFEKEDIEFPFLGFYVYDYEGKLLDYVQLPYWETDSNVFYMDDRKEFYVFTRMFNGENVQSVWRLALSDKNGSYNEVNRWYLEPNVRGSLPFEVFYLADQKKFLVECWESYFYKKTPQSAFYEKDINSRAISYMMFTEAALGIKTQVSDYAQEVDPEVYPNPSSDWLHIPIAGGNRVVKMYDIMGHQVLNNHNNEVSIDISMLPQGTYFLGVEEEGRIYRRTKVVKI